jgi:hypothetical protein
LPQYFGRRNSLIERFPKYFIPPTTHSPDLVSSAHSSLYSAKRASCPSTGPEAQNCSCFWATVSSADARQTETSGKSHDPSAYLSTNHPSQPNAPFFTHFSSKSKIRRYSGGFSRRLSGGLFWVKNRASLFIFLRYVLCVLRFAILPAGSSLGDRSRFGTLGAQRYAV